MKTFKLLVLTFIATLSISCSKDEEIKPTLYGKWEFDQMSDGGSTSRLGDYPGNVPGCKKDYLYILHGKTVIRGDFEDDCEQDAHAGTWEHKDGLLELNFNYFRDIYKPEFLDNNTLKLSWDGTHNDNKASSFFILKRAPLEL